MIFSIVTVVHLVRPAGLYQRKTESLLWAWDHKMISLKLYLTHRYRNHTLRDNDKTVI